MHHGIQSLLTGLFCALLALSQTTAAATQANDSATEPAAGAGIEEPQELIVPEEAVNTEFGGLLGAWTLVALDGTTPVIDRDAPTLEIMADGTVAGFGGVNRYRARMKTGLPPGRVEITQGASTMMAGPEAVMATEQTFLQRLGAVSTFTIKGDTLRMYAGDNEALTFTRATRP